MEKWKWPRRCGLVQLTEVDRFSRQVRGFWNLPAKIGGGVSSLVVGCLDACRFWPAAKLLQGVCSNEAGSLINLECCLLHMQSQQVSKTGPLLFSFTYTSKVSSYVRGTNA